MKKTLILITLAVTSFFCGYGQEVELVKSWVESGTYSNQAKSGVEIKQAYWKNGEYRISFIAMGYEHCSYEHHVNFAEGRLNLVYGREPGQTGCGDYLPRTFTYHIKGLPDKNFKLRFNGFRQGSIPIENIVTQPEPPGPIPIAPEPVWVIDEGLEPPVEEIIVDFVEEEPLWIGCSDQGCSHQRMMKYLSQQVKYPTMAKDAMIQGKVFVKFVIDNKGKPKDFKIVRGVHPLLDDEAIRVCKTLPTFTPGKIRGKAVNMYYTIPIDFRIR